MYARDGCTAACCTLLFAIKSLLEPTHTHTHCVFEHFSYLQNLQRFMIYLSCYTHALQRRVTCYNVYTTTYAFFYFYSTCVRTSISRLPKLKIYFLYDKLCSIICTLGVLGKSSTKFQEQTYDLKKILDSFFLP